MARTQYIWNYKTATCSLPLVSGLAFILLSYHTIRTATKSAIAPPSFAILLSIIVPVTFIWLIAAYGAARFKEYAYSIKDTQDGKSLNDISNALLLLLPYMILLTMANSIESLFVHSSNLSIVVGLGNYIPIIFALASVYYLLRGSNELIVLIPHQKRNVRRFTAISSLCLLLFAGFAWSFWKSVPLLEPVNGIPKFAASVDVLLPTYVFPHLLLWTCGIWACTNIAHYAVRTEGKIYRLLFQDLYRGILLVYICLFIAQVLTISSISYAYLSLSLGLVYGLLVIAAIGFVYIVRGSRKLANAER